MDILENNKILIIAPHQDDETIGCGGLIGYALAHGCSVEVVHVFSGTTGIANKPNGVETSSIRQEEALQAAQLAGFTLLPNLGFLDRTKPKEYDIQTALINTIRSSKPDLVLLPHPNESDVEHALVGRVGKESVWLAASNIETNKSRNGVSRVRTVMYYSVWTPFTAPQLYLEVTRYIDLKKRTLACYKSQMESTAWEEGSIGINRYWGTRLLGNGYCEVFECEPIQIGGKDG